MQQAEPAPAKWPWSVQAHGPLSVLLVVLTVVTGLIDAVSYVGLGHVFVANMTGNVVFLAFALAGAPGLSVSSSLTALAAFLVGAVVSGRIGAHLKSHRGNQLRAAMAISAVTVLMATIAAAVGGLPLSGSERTVLIVTLGLAMGSQNATARRLAVPDLTTTVLTLTLTGIAADSRLAGGSGGHPARRLIAVTAMFLGGLVGALLVLDLHRLNLVIPLAVATALVIVVGFVVHRHSRGEPPWSQPIA